MHKKLIALTLALILLCSLALPGAAAVPDLLQTADAPRPLSDEKVYCKATLEDDFADDRVVVVLSNKASTSLHTYTKADFAGIGCTKVQNLTQYTTERVNAKLTGKTEEVQRAAEPNVITFEGFNEVDTESFRQILCLTLEEPGKQNVLDAIAALMKHPDVISAEPDYVVYAASTTPNDPYRSEQWAIDKIQLRDAWDITTGSSTVRVGVIDSGIDGQHPELRSKINVSLSRDFTIDGSGAEVSTVTDSDGHGTHVAGIIGAATNNSTGISGVCHNIELVSLQICDTWANPSVTCIYQAVDYARSQNISILNMSVIWKSSNATQAQTTAAFSVLNNYPGLIICAAGNDALDLDDDPSYDVFPARFELPNVIVVGASAQDDSPSTSSNHGALSVDLFAPGVSILSCHPLDDCNYIFHSSTTSYEGHYLDGYHYRGGTSMATPYVTGVAALIKARYPNLSVTQIKDRILGGVDFVLALNNNCVTSGRLNAYKALHPHSFAHYNSSVTHHLSVCTCGAIYEKEEHTYVQVGRNLYVCEVCEYESEWIP